MIYRNPEFEKYKLPRYKKIRYNAVFGVGTNDADYAVTIHNKKIGSETIEWMCPAYQCWHSVIRRSFSDYAKKKNTAYLDITCCEDWKLFSNFRDWYVEQNPPRGYALDKDLIKMGNNEYGPQFCAFVPRYLNNLFTDHKQARGKYPLGISNISENGKLRVYCSDGYGDQKHIGYYICPIEAHRAWKKAKIAVVKFSIDRYVKEEYVIDSVLDGLYFRLNILENSLINDTIIDTLH